MAQTRITVAQLATRIDAMEKRDNETQELLRTLIAAAKAPAKAAKAPAKAAKAPAKAAKAPAKAKEPAYVSILTVTDKFPTLAEIEKALLPDQCQFWAHRKHDGTAKAKDSYRDNMPALIVQCNKANCNHKPGEFRPDRYYTGPLGYHAERADFHKRWRAEFGPVNEKAGK